MNTHIARAMLVQDRMDWNRPHLNWLPSGLYRLAREVIRKTK